MLSSVSTLCHECWSWCHRFGDQKALFFFFFFFLYIACFWAIINPRQRCGRGVSVRIPHIKVTRDKGSTSAAEVLMSGSETHQTWTLGRRHCWLSSVLPQLNIFYLLLFTKTVQNTNSEFWSLVWIYFTPPPLFYCHYQIFVAISSISLVLLDLVSLTRDVTKNWWGKMY